MTEKENNIPSLSDLTNKSSTDKTPAKKTASAKATPASAKTSSVKEDSAEGTTTPTTATEDDVRDSLNAKDERVTPEDEDKTDSAPGDGIISVKEHEEDNDDSEEAPLELGVLSRVHKMSPPGMSHLNTYSGGSETVIHDKQDVVIKPLAEAENKSQRVIEDETGKSRLLHPDVVRPSIPSEQGTVMGTYQEHVYATPYDPDADPNIRR